MTQPGDPQERLPPRVDIDGDGVDREQIRAMLRLSPAERLERAQEYVEAALEIRELNGPSPLL